MPAGELADAVSGFVETFERIGRGLDFDIEVSAGRPGAAAPGLRRRLFPEWAWTWDVWAAVAQAARRSGPTAAPVYAASVEARDLLLRSLEGDPDAWRRDRDRVLQLLAMMQASCPAPPVAPAVPPVSRAAQATTPKPPVVLNVEERTMLKTLWENGAESEADGSRLKKEDVEAFGKMKPYARRKAADSLYQQGLIDRFNDRRGGYWLTPRGIEVARSIWPPKNRGPQ